MLLAVSAWAGGLAALGLPGWTCGVLLALGLLVLVARHRRGSAVVTLAACLLAAAAVAGAAAVRAHVNRTGVVAELAGQQAAVAVTGRVTSDPVLRNGGFGPYTLTRMTVSEVVGRGQAHRTRAGRAGHRGRELGPRGAGRPGLGDRACLEAPGTRTWRAC